MDETFTRQAYRWLRVHSVVSSKVKIEHAYVYNQDDRSGEAFRSGEWAHMLITAVNDSNQEVDFFENIPSIIRKIRTLKQVGLGYLTLGQSATTLSGGEAQRIKLASELSKRSTGNTFYILDEPTTGLHFQDVKVLLEVLDSIVDKGNSVLVIEHNLDVIKVADYIIDLGKGGGENGGYIVCQGTPEKIIGSKESYTADFLRNEL